MHNHTHLLLEVGNLINVHDSLHSRHQQIIPNTHKITQEELRMRGIHMNNILEVKSSQIHSNNTADTVFCVPSEHEPDPRRIKVCIVNLQHFILQIEIRLHREGQKPTACSSFLPLTRTINDYQMFRLSEENSIQIS